MEIDRPLNVLNKHLNSHVAVVLKSGIEYKGRMVQCDEFMNIMLEDGSEYFNGRLVAKYGKILIRGNNIVYIVLNALATL